MYQKCPLCEGTGKINDKICHVCNGKCIISEFTGLPPKDIPIEQGMPRPYFTLTDEFKVILRENLVLKDEPTEQPIEYLQSGKETVTPNEVKFEQLNKNKDEK